jgi:hypothetical protein
MTRLASAAFPKPAASRLRHNCLSSTLFSAADNVPYRHHSNNFVHTGRLEPGPLLDDLIGDGVIGR